MSAADHTESKHEIIIVKHGRGDHEDGHHGGVWKIAFADFMTAMMCFFLVMWLINAANEQTKASVASYFNPVKLIDRNSSRKGLEDIGDGPNSVGTTSENQDTPETRQGQEGQATGGAADKTSSSQSEDEVKTSDEHLFADPYAVLAEIAGDAGVKQNVSEKGDGGAQTSGPSTGASGGESYRDPFAPDFWSQQVASPDAAEQSAERSKTGGNEPPTESPEETAASEAEPVEAADDKAAAEVKQEQPAEEPKPADAEKQPSDAVTETADRIRKELAEAIAPGELHDGLSVVATDKGVVISVTDRLDFGMFEVGSALPRRELVLAMEKIGKALEGEEGAIAVNGHTDARPFRNAAYDNWRLSTARAHSAYYMLARSGLDERRITEVAGFADRKLKDAADPLSAVNRRIEILLEIGG